MKIFIIGLPKSGRTTVAQALSEGPRRQYIDATGWIRSTFREPQEGEHLQQFEDEYHRYLSMRMMVNPFFVTDHVRDMIEVSQSKTVKTFVIDGVFAPKDFTSLFDYREDMVIFLNRTDNETDVKDHENIGVSVMRDYCFWMSSAGLLPKERWLEYNFRIPGEDSEFIKELGSKNSVFLIKSLSRVIAHIKDKVSSFADKYPTL
jgi:adenylate kinase family enzyme